MRRRIELYGRLRDAGLGAALSVVLPEKATARQVLDAVGSALGPNALLLRGCVLADGENVLPARERVPLKGRLAVLPPVCGG